MAPPWPCCTSSAACCPRVTRRIAWWWRRKSRNRWNAACARGSAHPVPKPERPLEWGRGRQECLLHQLRSTELWKTLSKTRLVVCESIAESSTYDELTHPAAIRLTD